MENPTPTIIKAVDPQAEFCTAFLSKVLKMYEKKIGNFSPTKYQKIILEGIHVLNTGGLFLLGFGSLTGAAAAVVKKGAEELTKLCHKFQGLQIEEKKRRQIDETSSADFKSKFRRTLLAAAVIFYNIYEFQLEHIYMTNKDESLSQIPALKKIAEFIGKRTFEHLTETLKGKQTAFELDENAFKRHWSKFKDFLNDKELILMVGETECKKMDKCQIFQNSVPVFYRQVNDQGKLWMRKEDWDKFCKEYQEQVNFLRRPIQFEWDTFNEQTFTVVHVGVSDISIYKPPQVDIDNLLREIDLKYSSSKIKQERQVHEIHAVVCEKLDTNFPHESGTVKKFNNINKALCSNLMKPPLAESLLQTIERAAANKSPETIEDKIVLIHGMGGVGKSSLARWCAEQQGDNNVWWINAETPLSILSSFTQLADCLKIYHQKLSSTETEEQYGQRLGTLVFGHIVTFKIKDVLLIYDNGNQMNSTENDGAFGIFNHLPKFPQAPLELEFLPTILITSQWSHWKTLKEHTFPLESWDEAGTIHFLKSRFNLYKKDLCPHSQEDSQDFQDSQDSQGSELVQGMKELHKCLGGFPLVTAIVASNIIADVEDLEGEERNSLSLGESRKSLCARVQNMCNVDFVKLQSLNFCTGDSRNYAITLKTVWSSTMNRLKQKSGEEKYELALHLLDLMAFIPNDEITVERLHFTLHPLHLTVSTEFRKSTAFTNTGLAVKVLEKYSLAKIDRGQQFHHQCQYDNDEERALLQNRARIFFRLIQSHSKVQIHRLVQQRVRANLDQHVEKTAVEKVLGPLADFFVLYNFCGEEWSILKDLADFQWPGKTHEQFMTIIAGLLLEFPVKLDLKVIRGYLTCLTNRLETRAREYSNLCKMALVLCRLYEQGKHQRQSSKADSSPDSIIIKPPIVVARNSKTIDWVLAQVEKGWEKNHSFFYIGFNCLDHFEQSDFTEEAKQETRSWLAAFFKRISEHPRSLPPKLSFHRLLDLAKKVGVSTENCSRFVLQAAQALNGLDDEMMAKFRSSRFNLQDIWCFDYLEVLDRVVHRSKSEYEILAKDQDVTEILVKMFSKTITSYTTFRNRDSILLSITCSIMRVIQKMACTKDFAVTIIKSSQFSKSLQDLLEWDNIRNCPLYPWIESKIHPADHLIFLVLMTGFSIFSHDILVIPGDPSVQKMFHKFVAFTGKVSMALSAHRNGLQRFEYKIRANIKWFTCWETEKSAQIQVMNNFVTTFEKNEINDKEAINLVNVIRKVLESDECSEEWTACVAEYW